MSEPALRLERIERRFHQGEARLEVLKGASLELAAGEVVALVGPSGSGKSTLLQIAGLLEHADAGEVVVGERACSTLNDGERTRIRRDSLGFVYQFHHLLPEFTALENVALPQMIAGEERRRAAGRAEAMLAALGLGGRLHHRPGRLSGGEQQRVAIARALANRPKVLLADEPTGNLDETTGRAVFEALTAAVRATQAAALIATHNLELAARADRVLRLHDGVIEATATSRTRG
ncbi:MAG TPA: ABC transporter ATP-binding protein [Geminicoccaceae bacterium]